MDNTNAPALTGQDLMDNGDYLYIPAWKMGGMPVATRPATMGTEAAIEVLIEVKPDDPKPRWFRLEPHEYEVL